MERVNVVDGANGYVGSNLVHDMLASGRRVITLSRTGSIDTRKQIAEGVVGAGRNVTVRADDVPVLDYSLADADLALDPDEIEQMFDEPVDFWHCAALTSFLPGKRGELTRVNVDGTRNTLELFTQHAKPGSRYMFVSTAYTCGLVDAPVPEDWQEIAQPSAFRNFYERSKREAELVVRDFMSDRGVEGAILRLGQVVGDSVTGETTTPYGVYDFMRVISTIAKKRPGEEIRIKGDPDAVLHLVPVDATTRWMLTIADAGDGAPVPPIFHVVDRGAVRIETAGEVISEIIPLTFDVVAKQELEDQPLTHLERVVDARIQYAGSYLSRPLEFERGNLDLLTPDEAPVVDHAVLERLVRRYLETLPK